MTNHRNIDNRTMGFCNEFCRYAKVKRLCNAALSQEVAPYTDYLSKMQIQQLFKMFLIINIAIQRFDDYSFVNRVINIQIKWFLNNLTYVLGLDLYVRVINYRYGCKSKTS